MFEAAQRAVSEFNQAFNLPISTSPRRLPAGRVKLRAKWMKEEIAEFEKASDIVDQADAIADLVYFALGVFVEMGINGSDVFKVVHRANMEKLPSSGVALYDKEGRVTKPRNWKSPQNLIKKILHTD